MTRIEACFLETYRRALEGHPPGEADPAAGAAAAPGLTAAEWRQLFALAESHRVFPMVFGAVCPNPAAADTPLFRAGIEKARKLTCGQARMTAEFLKLYRFLTKRGLRPLVMKGIICRSLYPEPEQRSSSDEDLLIPAEEFAAYHQALTEFGLRVADPHMDIEREHEVPYCSGQVYIELHKTPFPPESKAYGDLNRFFGDVETRRITERIYGVPVAAMGCTDHLFYQLCHAYKHFLNCGIGIRLVSDIVLFSMMFLNRIDWDLIVDRCREIRAVDFVSAIYRIGEKYLFPDRFPRALQERWATREADEEAMLQDILVGGVYGTSSEDRLHSANITLGTAASSKSGSGIPVMVRTLFPSADTMKRSFPRLERYPFLLPAAWMRRLWRYGADSVLRGRRGNRASEAVRIGNERVELMRRYRILEERKSQPGLLKRIYKKSHTSVMAPVLSPLYRIISMAEFHALNMIARFQGARRPTEAEKTLVRKNVTFIVKSFERQHLAKGLCRNISRLYPGTIIIIADDSRQPLTVGLPNVKVIRLPFNSGLGAGLAAALAAVETPYVMRMDDDELLMTGSLVHRELRYLMEHPETDLVGFGHTTAIRLHSPRFNFQEYYKCPMDDAPRTLKVPHLTVLDENHVVLGKVANIYLARTEKIREVGFDPKIRVIDHHDFFWRAAGVITSAVALDTVVFHRHDPYEQGYNLYRSDYAADLEYIREKRTGINKEVRIQRERTEKQ